jgi:hypothetical protein
LLCTRRSEADWALYERAKHLLKEAPRLNSCSVLYLISPISSNVAALRKSSFGHDSSGSPTKLHSGTNSRLNHLACQEDSLMDKNPDKIQNDLPDVEKRAKQKENQKAGLSPTDDPANIRRQEAAVEEAIERLPAD